jgi:hypothetical protein
MSKRVNNSKEKILGILEQYSQNATICGLHYAFEPNQSLAGRIIWMLALMILSGLGIYMSIQNYQQWKEEPVLTTLTTTGQPHFKENYK